MLDRCDQLDFVRFVGIARRIWLWRNEVIHSGLLVHLKLIIQQAIQAGGNFQTITAGQKDHTSSMGELTMTNWKAPPHDYLKINWDAGIDFKRGCVGLGAIICNHQGRMWASKSQTRLGFMDPTTVETMATLMAVQLCQEKGIRKAQLEGDAKIVIDTIISSESDESSNGQLTEDIRETLQAIPWWEMNYVC
jgi:ribonuclease HI